MVRLQKPWMFLITLCIVSVLSACAFATKSAPEPILIKRDMQITDCDKRGIEEIVLFIYSRYCPHCKKAMPVVEKLVAQKRLVSKYIPIDTSTKEGRGLLKQYGIRVQFVPTLIKDCKAYVGSKKKEFYEGVFRGMSHAK